VRGSQMISAEDRAMGTQSGIPTECAGAGGQGDSIISAED